MRALVLLALMLLGCGRDSSGTRAAKQLAELQKQKEAEKKAQKDEKLAPMPTVLLKLFPPYEESLSTIIVSDGACPEGFWALFPNVEAPGKTPEEKKANAARRKELEADLRSRQYLVKLRGPEVKLSAYDAAAGQFTIDVAGTVDCTDAMGRIAVAWTAAKAQDPGASAAKEGSELNQHMWLAPPVTFTLPMKVMTEAKEFADKNRIGLSARAVFKLGKVEVDKKLKKVGKVKEKVELAGGLELAYGGGVEDWGAGRLVRVELVGLRVAADQERRELFDQKK